MKFIERTQGQFAKVDDADFEELSAYKWNAKWQIGIEGYYACRALPI
jgi:hypothetical protein